MTAVVQKLVSRPSRKSYRQVHARAEHREVANNNRATVALDGVKCRNFMTQLFLWTVDETRDVEAELALILRFVIFRVNAALREKQNGCFERLPHGGSVPEWTRRLAASELRRGRRSDKEHTSLRTPGCEPFLHSGCGAPRSQVLRGILLCRELRRSHFHRTGSAFLG